ncbi:MAG: deoxyribonuclease, partial [Candidatus Puniceispirillum sp.]|nr:deoxyribonuclease [Candidatus Puniceispirillum sp.]
MNSAVDKNRAHKVEIEHIATADVIGHGLACWQNSICEHHGKPYKGRK